MSISWPTVVVACVFIVSILVAFMYSSGSDVEVRSALLVILGAIGTAVAALMERAVKGKK